jgi:alpha-tubulin suppressor-like RCC1 family protein
LSASTLACMAASEPVAYSWGDSASDAILGRSHDAALGYGHTSRPNPIEALCGVRVGSVAAGGERSYAVADTGEVWAWGSDTYRHSSLGHGERRIGPVPVPVVALRGIKVDAAIAGHRHTLTLADDGYVYAWGHGRVAHWGVLGLGPSVSDAGECVPTPTRIPALSVGRGL